LAAVEHSLRAGNATEHTHRTAFEQFLEALFPALDAVNEPSRSECGAPDYVVTRKRPRMTLGYVEAKDVGVNLRKLETTAQLKRYRTLPNLLFTDYLSFRWYVDGEVRDAAALAEWNGKKLVTAADNGAAAIALLQKFAERVPVPIRSARHLAERLAPLTHQVRDIVTQALAQDASQLLRLMLRAFRETLIPDLPEDQFADMYAQTITYGLFTARCNDTSTADFTRAEALELIPHSNPFLRQVFQFVAGPGISDEPFAGFVDDIICLLAHADMASVMADFGMHNKKEDPVVHFYETFLGCYDPALREARGVYYTPAPAVNYIVCSVDAILKDEFGLAAGLADSSRSGDVPRTLILDPACGTGTFLYAVVDLIRRQFMAHHAGGQWADYVRTHLIPRIFGFELLMAPYAVAHFKLALQLAGQDLPAEERQRWAFAFDKKSRLNVFLTNTLEEAVQRSEIMFAQYLSNEANAAAAIKKDLPIMVVLGNPPYSNFGQMNRGAWILNLLQEYKQGLREKKMNLDDDFVKFIRWGQWRIDRTGAGVLAFVTNNTYLDGITHRRMREALLASFSDIYILNLHGNLRKQEACPDGTKDENIFDIQQGVAIAIFVKNPGKKMPGRLHYADLWGSRQSKYAYLDRHHVHNTRWQALKPARDYFFFTPKDFSGRRDYECGIAITDIFAVFQNGIKTDRDELFCDMDRGALVARMKTFYSAHGVVPPFSEQYRVQDSSSYDLLARRAATHYDEHCIHPCLYRPFDTRWLYYKIGLTSRPADRVMQHMLAGPNVALIAARQFAGHRHFVANCTNTLTEISSQPFAPLTLFPLYLYPAVKANPAGRAVRGLAQALIFFEPQTQYPARRHNLQEGFLDVLGRRLGMSFVNDGSGDLKKSFGPEDVFHYIYAILHSPAYRMRYAEFLKIEFPRIPLTSSAPLFKTLCGLGMKLASLHLLQSPLLDDCHQPLTSSVKYPQAGTDEVTRVVYAHGAVFINATQHFTPVPEAVWQFHVGGYQVCEKWLKDRKGRVLSADEKVHFQKIVVALEHTIALMDDIDRAVPQWPL
jgi:predicted helicase